VHGCMSSRNMIAPSDKFGTKTSAAFALLHFSKLTSMEVDVIRHMDQSLRASWHGMPAENLIIAEVDKWRMNLGQTPCLSRRRPDGK